MRLEEIVERSCRPFERIVIGVSGGADSTALLRALVAAHPEGLTVVNCNFNLRGDESRRDSEFVAGLCEELGVPLVFREFQALEYSRTEGVSVEMACRTLRYDFFRETAARVGAERIAVAHNADDNIETLFLNLFRTAGVEGLKGMLPDTGEILRPLLSVSRAEIVAYLESVGQPYVTDSTNADTQYLRNFVRHDLLPLIESRWPAARKTIAASQEILLAEALTLRALSPDGERILPLSRIVGEPTVALSRFALPKGANSAQIREMARLVGDYRKGPHWEVGSGCIYADAEGFVYDSGAGVAETEYMCERIEMTAKVWEAVKRAPVGEAIYLPQSYEHYYWRAPQPGDRLRLMGRKGSAKVADILKESGLSYPERRRRRVLVNSASGEILAVEGLKRSGADLVSRESEYVYRISAVKNGGMTECLE